MQSNNVKNKNFNENVSLNYSSLKLTLVTLVFK